MFVYNRWIKTMLTKLINEEVQFTNTSMYTSPVSWLWNFGDGEISEEENPIHIYTKAGTYEVSLFVTDVCGSCNSSVDKVNIVTETSEIDWNTIIPIAAGVIGVILIARKL